MTADDPVRREVIRQFRESWSRTRLKGRRRWALTYGVAVWGALAALGYLAFQIIKGQFNILIDAGTIVLISAGGYFVGLKIWDANEAHFIATEPVNPAAQNPDAPPE